MEEKQKFPKATEVIANLPQRDTYDKSHGSGNPHLQPGELQGSEAWKSHRPAKPVKPAKK